MWCISTNDIKAHQPPKQKTTNIQYSKATKRKLGLCKGLLQVSLQRTIRRKQGHPTIVETAKKKAKKRVCEIRDIRLKFYETYIFLYHCPYSLPFYRLGQVRSNEGTSTLKQDDTLRLFIILSFFDFGLENPFKCVRFWNKYFPFTKTLSRSLLPSSSVYRLA